MSFEYKVVPAPTRGVKAKGVKTSDDRFANALEVTMNAMAAEGWEYQRVDTLPCEEREGLMGKTTVYKNMLVFRRSLHDEAVAVAPVAMPEVSDETPEDQPALEHRPADPDTLPEEPKLTADEPEDEADFGDDAKSPAPV